MLVFAAAAEMLYDAYVVDNNIWYQL